MKKLTLNEKIKLTRWRLGQTQDHFYEGICDQQTGSYIENNNWKGDPSRLVSIMASVVKVHNCDTKNITISEMIKLYRQRLGIRIEEAIKLFNTNKVSLIKVEDGLKKDDKQLLTYQKISSRII